MRRSKVPGLPVMDTVIPVTATGYWAQQILSRHWLAIVFHSTQPFSSHWAIITSGLRFWCGHLISAKALFPTKLICSWRIQLLNKWTNTVHRKVVRSQSGIVMCSREFGDLLQWPKLLWGGDVWVMFRRSAGGARRVRSPGQRKFIGSWEQKGSCSPHCGGRGGAGDEMGSEGPAEGSLWWALWWWKELRAQSETVKRLLWEHPFSV